MVGTMLDSLIEWKTGSDCESNTAFHHGTWTEAVDRVQELTNTTGQVMGNSSLSSDHGESADDIDQRLARKRPAPPSQAERKRLMTEARLRHREGGERSLAEKISTAAEPWHAAVKVIKARFIFALRSKIEKENQDGAIEAFEKVVSVLTSLFFGGLQLRFLPHCLPNNPGTAGT
ncbi:hypothetical protein KEM56_004045 [Ascosphaera pollenicola]|nr:hypothetical protein KEM56_004045 [Ascosphaera pollenicola]